MAPPPKSLDGRDRRIPRDAMKHYISTVVCSAHCAVFGASGPPPRPGSPVTTKSAFFGADDDPPPVELACAAAFARASAKICALRASLAESLLAKFASASSFPPARAGAATVVNAAAKDVAMNARRSTAASRRADDDDEATTTTAFALVRVDLFRCEPTTVEPTRADAFAGVRTRWNMALRWCARVDGNDDGVNGSSVRAPRRRVWGG